jgi:ribosomal protein L30/L7E
MNYAPSIRRTAPYVVMARYPVIADTLIMLGLNELDQWKEVERVEKLARKMLEEDYEDEDENENGGRKQHVNELGNVAKMMEELVGGLIGPQAATNQLARILMVLAQAQASQLIPGFPRDGTEGGLGEDDLNPSDPGLISEQMIGRRILSLSPGNIGLEENGRPSMDENGRRDSASRSRIQTPQDAANLLQLNAFLLGPFQVEVLFVLCTLLGGRRKIDTQELLKKHGII